MRRAIREGEAHLVLIAGDASSTQVDKVRTTMHDKAIRTVIQKYTREAGLRNLEREIAKVFRKLARRVAEGNAGPFNVTPKLAESLLGVPRITPEMALTSNQAMMFEALHLLGLKDAPEGFGALFERL